MSQDMFLGTSICKLAGHYELAQSCYAELGTMGWVKATRNWEWRAVML